MRTIKKEDIINRDSEEEINELVDSDGQEIEGSSDGMNTGEIRAKVSTDKHKGNTRQGPRFMFNYGGMEFNGASSKNKSVSNIDDYGLYNESEDDNFEYTTKEVPATYSTRYESEEKMGEMLEELLLDKDDKPELVRKDFDNLVKKALNKLYKKNE